MASGEPVVHILDVMPTATVYATMDSRPGASTPAEASMVLDFDTTTAEYVDYKCVLIGYDGGGLTFTIPYSASTATSGVCRWAIGIRRIQDDAEDMDAAHTYDYNAVDDTTASLSGELSYPTLAFTNGADMDSWADGELAIVRLRRDVGSANDTMAGDAELWGLIGKET